MISGAWISPGFNRRPAARSGALAVILVGQLPEGGAKGTSNCPSSACTPPTPADWGCVRAGDGRLGGTAGEGLAIGRSGLEPARQRPFLHRRGSLAEGEQGLCGDSNAVFPLEDDAEGVKEWRDDARRAAAPSPWARDRFSPAFLERRLLPRARTLGSASAGGPGTPRCGGAQRGLESAGWPSRSPLRIGELGGFRGPGGPQNWMTAPDVRQVG